MEFVVQPHGQAPPKCHQISVRGSWDGWRARQKMILQSFEYLVCLRDTSLIFALYVKTMNRFTSSGQLQLCNWNHWRHRKGKRDLYLLVSRIFIGNMTRSHKWKPVFSMAWEWDSDSESNSRWICSVGKFHYYSEAKSTIQHITVCTFYWSHFHFKSTDV